MDKFEEKLEELFARGYECSQIMVALGLYCQGKTNWDLVRSLESLSGGLGYSGKLCGALTGAACMLGMYAGRGPAEEKSSFDLNTMVRELVEWYEETIGKEYGGTNCDHITEHCLDKDELCLPCMSIVTKTYQKVRNILCSRGFNMEKGRCL